MGEMKRQLVTFQGTTTEQHRKVSIMDLIDKYMKKTPVRSFTASRDTLGRETIHM